MVADHSRFPGFQALDAPGLHAQAVTFSKISWWGLYPGCWVGILTVSCTNSHVTLPVLVILRLVETHTAGYIDEDANSRVKEITGAGVLTGVGVGGGVLTGSPPVFPTSMAYFPHSQQVTAGLDGSFMIQ